jgi:hypothetical protein
VSENPDSRTERGHIPFRCVKKSQKKHIVERRQILNLIIGGGTYGERAFAKIQKTNTSVVVIDIDPSCSVQKKHGLPVVTVEQISDPEELQQGAYFIQGGIAEAAHIVATHRPERIFPTVPVHVSAGIISEIVGFEPEPAGADEISTHIPERLVVGRNGSDIYCSLNPDMLCNPNCPEPAVCPVTGERRDVPLWSMLRSYLSTTLPDDAVPERADTHQTDSTNGGTRSVVIQSRQYGPGLGYIRCSDLFSAIDSVREKKTVWIGTACKCHGVVTALGRPDYSED